MIDQIIDYLVQLHPVTQALIATTFTWILTALGASLVFLTKELSRRTLDGMLGFTGGVMIAASFWSLLDPAIAMSENMAVPIWFPAAVGFFMGASFLFVLDKFLPHLHLNFKMKEREGIRSSERVTRCQLR